MPAPASRRRAAACRRACRFGRLFGRSVRGSEQRARRPRVRACGTRARSTAAPRSSTTPTPSWGPMGRSIPPGTRRPVRAAAASATSMGAIRPAPTSMTTPTACRSASPTRCSPSPIPPIRGTRITSATRWNGQNDIDLEFRGAGSAIFTVKCDVLTKFHQGTHSKDAFTNNVHELIYHIRCDNGAAHGDHHAHRDRHARASSCAPATATSTYRRARRPRRTRRRAAGSGRSPTGSASSSTCWWPRARTPTSARCTRPGRRRTSVRRADGHTLAHFNPYFQVRLPSRFHDPAIAPVVGRPIDVCYEVTATRRAGPRRRLRPSPPDDGQTPGVTFDDPRSEFNGADHFVDINGNNISNAGRSRGLVHRRVRAERPDRAVLRLDPPADRVGGQLHRAWMWAARPSATTGTTAWTGCGRRTESGATPAARSQRTSRMPPGSSRSLVKTWVMVTTR